MTIEELDEALGKVGLDLTNPECQKIRNMVLALHGQSIVDSKSDRCGRCWYKENDKCSPACFFNTLPDDPVEVSKEYLLMPNNIQIFPFLYLYFIPVYEQLTGDTDLVKHLCQEFKKRYKKEHGTVLTTAGEI